MRELPTETVAYPHAGSPAFMRIEHFESPPSDPLLRLSIRTSVQLVSAARPTLIVERDAAEHLYIPLLSCTGRAPLTGAGECEWLWRASFAVPPDIAGDQAARFMLELCGETRLALPVPIRRVLGNDEAGEGEDSRRAWPFAARRRTLLFVLACQLCVIPGWLGSAAQADSGTSTEPAPEIPPTTTEAVPPPTTEATPPSPPTTTTTEAAPPPPAIPNPQESVPGSPAIAAAQSPTSTPPAPSSTTATPPRIRPAAARPPHVTLSGGQKTTTARTHASKPVATHPRPSTPGAGTPNPANPPATNNVALPPQLAAAQASALAAEFAGSAASLQALDFYSIPPFLLPIYQAAALRYGVPWQILAAINEVETDYGRDLSVSSAGAVGWMQFMPATWIQYGVDALNAGYADPYNPLDAVFAAARYLRAAGAQRNLRGAILAYNHSDSYADSVLLRAKLISAYPRLATSTLTNLVDARPPVTGKRLAWDAPISPRSPQSATTSARTLSKSSRRTPGRPGSSAPPSPIAAARAATESAATRRAQLVSVQSSAGAAAVAVQDGRILRLGRSRRLGNFVILRDAHGDVFTYGGLHSIARSYLPAKTPPPPGPPKAPVVLPGSESSTRQGKLRLFAHPGNADAFAAAGRGTSIGHRSAHQFAGGGHRLPLRVGSVVSQGTVLGHVQVPPGAKDGHLRFAIRPAGDADTIDPRPILSAWTQLQSVLHPRGAKVDSQLTGEIMKSVVTKAAHSAGAARTSRATARSAGTEGVAPSPLLLGGELTSAQWDQLIARIAALPVPDVPRRQSSAAITDSK